MLKSANRFYRQIKFGCKSQDCRTPACLTYQRRKSKVPFRPYTVLSARALATFLASQDNPEAYLCPNELCEPVDSSETTLDRNWVPWHDGSATPGLDKPNGGTPNKDKKSFTQCLFDTAAFKIFQLAQIPEGYSTWAPWRHDKSPDPFEITDSDMDGFTSRLRAWMSRLYGPLSFSQQSPIEVDNRSSGAMVENPADRTPPGNEAHPNPDNAQHGIKAETNSAQKPPFSRFFATVMAQHHSHLGLIISGSIPKHSLIPADRSRSCRLAVGGVKPPASLAHFTVENSVALVESVRNLSEPSAYAENQFLRSLGRPTAAVKMIPFQINCVTNREREIAFATQSLVYVLNQHMLLKSPYPLDGTRASAFSDMVIVFRKLAEIDFHPTTVIPSLLAYLSRSEQILGNQIKHGYCIPAQAVFQSLPEDRAEEFGRYFKVAFTRLMTIVMAALVASVRNCSSEEWTSLQPVRASGRLIPREVEWRCSKDRRKDLMNAMDLLNDEMSLKLVKKLLRVTMMHSVVASKTSNFPDFRGTVIETWLSSCVREKAAWLQSIKTHPGRPSKQIWPDSMYMVVDWVRAVLLQEWDGKAFLTKGSSAWEAASFLSALCT